MSDLHIPSFDNSFWRYGFIIDGLGSSTFTGISRTKWLTGPILTYPEGRLLFFSVGLAYYFD